MKMMIKRVLTAAALLGLAAVSLKLAYDIKQFLERDWADNQIAISVVVEEAQEETVGTDETENGRWEHLQDEPGNGMTDEGMETSQEEEDQGTERTEKEEENRVDSGKDYFKKRPQWQYQIPAPTPLPPETAEESLPVVWLVSDLHYMSASMTDYSGAFDKFVAGCDGKVVRYLPQILDTVLSEAARERPDALILTGDITMDGEKKNHEELAGKLAAIQEDGIPVLVIPGNHDINNPHARVYFGEESQGADGVSLEEYKEIYEEFGVARSVSRDDSSFSYIYALRENIWLMLLDTAQYDPVNLVDGAVRPETYKWMGENLEIARQQGIQVIVLGHHNLLQESRMFTTMCVMENSGDVVELLERYEIPLYISGHLHLQRVKKHKKEPGAEGYGIYEIVSDAFSIPPCQYGIVSWQEDGTIDYRTRQADVSAWAGETESSDENLLNFPDYQREYIHQLIKEQVKKNTDKLPDDITDSMAWLYADLYAKYCAGLEINPAETERTEGFQSWQRYLPDSKELDEIYAMLGDSFEDSNRFVFSSEKY